MTMLNMPEASIQRAVSAIVRWRPRLAGVKPACPAMRACRSGRRAAGILNAAGAARPGGRAACRGRSRFRHGDGSVAAGGARSPAGVARCGAGAAVHRAAGPETGDCWPGPEPVPASREAALRARNGRRLRFRRDLPRPRYRVSDTALGAARAGPRYAGRSRIRPRKRAETVGTAFLLQFRRPGARKTHRRDGAC